MLGSAVLLVMKLFFQTKLRQWGKAVDRGVDLILVLLVTSYVTVFLWQWLSAG
jgi:hypothetical protein